MKDYMLFRKMTRIVMQLAETLDITPERALNIFYGTKVCEMLHDPKYGYQIMSDTYIVNDVISELRGVN